MLLQVAIDSAAPLDEAGPSGNTMLNSMDSFRGYGGPVRPYFDESPVRPYGRMYDSLDFDDVSVDYIFIIIICIAESL
jgi:RNA-binding protein Musashi